MLDIYFKSEYGKLCELVDGGDSCEFVLKSEYGTIRNMFIKRPVPYLLDGVQYYDAVTPYGYGGPVICSTNDKQRLLEVYEKTFRQYCCENRIVCEFIRYHPIFKNYEDFAPVYDTSFSRHTVGTNLFDFDDPVQSEFSKSARREVRKAEKEGVRCEVRLHPEDLSVFKQLYEETMDRNNASKMYYFPETYYDLLTSVLKECVMEIQVFSEDEIVASEIYFIAGDVMHAHLLGSNDKLLNVGGAIIEAEAAKWGKANGYRYIHHGGGRSSAEDDPLYLYKKKFGKHTEFDFYVGKKIWNQDAYDALVALRLRDGEIINSDYFPAYRV